jgi:hypothetical protein
VGGLRQLSHNRPFVLLTTITGVIFFAFQSVGVLNLYVNIYYVHEGNTARGAVMHGIWTTVYHVVAAAIIPVVIGADAHTPHRVADRYGDALRLLRTAGYTEVSFFLDRKRQTVAITDALASLGATAD